MSCTDRSDTDVPILDMSFTGTWNAFLTRMILQADLTLFKTVSGVGNRYPVFTVERDSDGVSPHFHPYLLPCTGRKVEHFVLHVFGINRKSHLDPLSIFRGEKTHRVPGFPGFPDVSIVAKHDRPASDAIMIKFTFEDKVLVYFGMTYPASRARTLVNAVFQRPWFDLRPPRRQTPVNLFFGRT